MRKLSYFVLTIFLVAIVVYISACASGGGASIDLKRDPIKPAPDLKEGTVNPSTNAITISKDGITVTSEHWSRARLDRKYTTASTRSIFFYLDTWSQSFQSEVFYITIKNETPRNLIFNEKETKLRDERQYELSPVSYADLKYRFESKSYMDLKTKNGLEVGRQILLTEVLGPSLTIPAGKTVEGFICFYTPSSQAEKVWLTIVLDKEPETKTAVYQKVNFRFDYRQDLVLRTTQPATKR